MNQRAVFREKLHRSQSTANAEMILVAKMRLFESFSVVSILVSDVSLAQRARPESTDILRAMIMKHGTAKFRCLEDSVHTNIAARHCLGQVRYTSQRDSAFRNALVSDGQVSHL